MSSMPNYLKKICSYFQEWFSLHYIVYVQFAFYKENNILLKVLDQVWHIILHRLSSLKSDSPKHIKVYTKHALYFQTINNEMIQTGM